jgi:hypothetical protein
MAVEITPQWLSEVLRESGALPRGDVLTCVSTDGGAHNSRLAHVKLTVNSEAGNSDARLSLPTRLVVKQNLDTPWAIDAGRQEVAFYTAMRELDERPPAIVPCLAAGIHTPAGDSFLILVDVSATHRESVSRDDLIRFALPTPRDAHRVTDALATMHAYWWERPVPEVPVAFWSRDRGRWDAYLERRGRSWTKVLSSNPSLPSRVVRFYDWLLARLSTYWERDLQARIDVGRALTLVHGDSYFANFLCPHLPNRNDVYLVDWQSPGFDIGADDLVNLLATFRTREQRLEEGWEIRLVRRYHERLTTCGVKGYSLEDLYEDYQRALITWVLVPVQDAADGSDYTYWFPKMQHLMDAFDDWDCERLLT